MQTDRGIAYSVAAHTQDTCCKTCAADPLCTGAVYLSESSSANSSDKLSWSIEHVADNRSSFLTSERCINISLNLVCPRACWRYCLVSLRHELLRKVDYQFFVGLKRTWDQKLSSGLTSGSLHSAITAWFFPTYMSFHLTAIEQSCCSL